MSALNQCFVRDSNYSVDGYGEVPVFSPLMKMIFYCLFAIVFSLAFVGNMSVLITCYKTYKVNTSVLLSFVASLSSADLMFTLLTIFNAIAFTAGDDWFGGNPVCKLQAFFIESSYTVSILTLVAISRERLKAVSSPILARAQRRTERIVLPVIIWMVGILACTPLLLLYDIKKDKRSGKSLCVNEYMGDKGRQIYYSIQAGLLFLLPLAFMSFAHIRIFQLLSHHDKSTTTTIRQQNKEGLKQRKVTKMLALVTLVFFILYGPFMVIRALRYFYIYNGDLIWRSSQMMIFVQAAVNPIIYFFYSKQFRIFLKDLICSRFRT